MKEQEIFFRHFQKQRLAFVSFNLVLPVIIDISIRPLAHLMLFFVVVGGGETGVIYRTSCL